MLQEIIESIFTPGINNSVRIFTCCVFVALFIVLSVMVYATNFNIHVIIMLVLATGVFASLCWFMIELELVKASEQSKKQQELTDPSERSKSQQELTDHHKESKKES